MTPEDDKPLTPAQARQKLQKGLADYLAGQGSETIVFRLKRTKKANETYSLKLTQQRSPQQVAAEVGEENPVGIRVRLR